ncbi:MAG: PhoD-like phosphatase N-terminal domain-containing protein, partial [Gammaproteobacteria bacterium]
MNHKPDTKTPAFFLPILVSGLTACCNVMAEPSNAPIQTPNGVVVGDVDSDSAVIWSRADREAEMQVRLHGKHHGASEYKTNVAAADDFTGRIKLTGLKADTTYDYEVAFKAHGAGASKSPALHGHFRTAPMQDADNAVNFAWGGDLAGQNVCR